MMNSRRFSLICLGRANSFPLGYRGFCHLTKKCAFSLVLVGKNCENSNFMRLACQTVISRHASDRKQPEKKWSDEPWPDERVSYGTPHFRQGMRGLSELEIIKRIKRKETIFDPKRAIGVKAGEPDVGTHAMPHPIWTSDELENVQVTHTKPQGFVDRWAYFSVVSLRVLFDLFSGYYFGKMTENKWWIRIIFLETLAGVPGMVGAMVRHLHSLRRLKRDHGWIHTLLEDAENERMHLLMALHMYHPGAPFRFMIILAQGIFTNWFFLCYLCSPRFCHRFVGYLEEEAVKTYSRVLADIDSGTLIHWKEKPAPKAAIDYWHLREDASVRDMIFVIRADEAHHRLVNHTLASIEKEDYNPFKPGQ